MSELKEKCKALLLAKKQIIFTGAPGTGKTYLAKEIAKELVGYNKAQTSFVQFHPSYDYTDFVEGLRPIKKEGSSELGFELKNGTFKEFCRKAGVIERLKAAEKDVNDENIADFLKGTDNELIEFWKQNKDKDLPKFVFIIDEVNRAEISKVFGELFFSIDPGYRGADGKVKTQYANMQTESTFFINKDDDYFFVPSNVYIIATMNDIDRSVETFDFAMRRRFTWVEITADDTKHSILSDTTDKDSFIKAIPKIARLEELNKAIEKIAGLNSSYHIGASYFLKLENNNYEELWDYHLEPLLKEYLRNMPDAEVKLEKLKGEYNNGRPF